MKIIKKTILVLSFLSLLSTAKAETLVVTTTSDDSTATSCDSSGTGTCSLRGALSVASSGDVVKLQAATYCITDKLDITTSLTIEGVKGSTAIDGANISGSGSTTCTTTASGKRILNIDDGSSATTTTPDVLLDGIIIKNGMATSDYGGGISARYSTLRIENSSIINNQITSPSSELRGGGIHLSDTSLTLINSTVSGNSAVTTSSSKVQGGGITITGSTTVLNIINSTISGNTATSGSITTARGGGIFSFTGPKVIIQNSTITGNTTNGRGGGINVNNAEVFSSIIYGNTDGSTSSGDDCTSNTFTSLGNNFIPTSTCKDSVGSYTTASGDITSGDPLLSALASNGGPTQTHALADTTSLAIAGGSCSSTSTDITTINSDQRGYYRTDTCDIGAFEYFASGTTLTYCGDLTVQSSYEECEDGNSVNTDACTNSCKNAICGDGYVQAGVEACDDGNTVDDGNGCSETCTAIVITDADGDGHDALAFGGDDCDDTEIAVNPEATETCDGIDNNCDGLIDDSTATGQTTWYPDADGDGFGSFADGNVTACSAPAGYINDNDDCDDTDPAINPDATEILGNSVDENCDGSLFLDSDGDDYTSDVDCDDTNSDINPDVSEILSDGIDQNCDGLDATDNDADGYSTPDDGDCDDTDPAINPDATEIPGNSVDENCDNSLFLDGDGDGYTSDVDCDDTNSDINPGIGDTPNNGTDENCDGVDSTDNDADGFSTPDDGDCDDTDPAINPDATEIPDNGIDENCDPSDDVTSGTSSGGSTTGGTTGVDPATSPGGGGGCSFQAY